MNVFCVYFFVQPMHARMRAERGLFWYDSLHWYDSPYNTSSTGLLGFGATFGVPIRAPLRALSRYSSALGKSTVPEPFSPVYCTFVCLFVSTVPEGPASLRSTVPPVRAKSTVPNICGTGGGGPPTSIWYNGTPGNGALRLLYHNPTSTVPLCRVLLY